jgi:hypothetical protein
MKKFIIFAVLICVLCTLSAQKRRNFKAANRFSNSIEFSVGGGVHGLSLVQEAPADGFNLNLMGKFSMGYHFTPVLGTRFTLKGGNTMSDPENIPGFTVAIEPLVHTSVDLLINLTNLWETRPKRNNKAADVLTNKSLFRLGKTYWFGNPTVVFGAGVVTFRQKDVKVQYSNLAFNGGILFQLFSWKGFSLNAEANLMLSNNSVHSQNDLGLSSKIGGGWISTADVSFSANFKIPTKHKNQRRYYTGGRRY